MDADEVMKRIDTLLSHVWMVRTFLKHCDEVEEDDDLRDVHRGLYDYMLAVGDAWRRQDAQSYLKQAKKKLRRLREATKLFTEIQPEVSGQTNFQMGNQSLASAVEQIGRLIERPAE